MIKTWKLVSKPQEEENTSLVAFSYLSQFLSRTVIGFFFIGVGIESKVELLILCVDLTKRIIWITEFSLWLFRCCFLEWSFYKIRTKSIK